jgi:hypothetical protein
MSALKDGMSAERDACCRFEPGGATGARRQVVRARGCRRAPIRLAACKRCAHRASMRASDRVGRSSAPLRCAISRGFTRPTGGLRVRGGSGADARRHQPAIGGDRRGRVQPGSASPNRGTGMQAALQRIAARRDCRPTLRKW